VMSEVPDVRAWYVNERGEREMAISILSPGRCAAALHGQFAFLNHWVLTTLVRSAYPHYAFGSMRHTAPTPQKEDPCTSI